MLYLEQAQKNSIINRIHQRELKLVYFDHVSFLGELLRKVRSFSIHHRNIRSVAIENFEFFQVLSPGIRKYFFQLNTHIPRNLKSHNELYCKNSKIKKCGTNTLS